MSPVGAQTQRASTSGSSVSLNSDWSSTGHGTWRERDAPCRVLAVLKSANPYVSKMAVVNATKRHISFAAPPTTNSLLRSSSKTPFECHRLLRYIAQNRFSTTTREQIVSVFTATILIVFFLLLHYVRLLSLPSAAFRTYSPFSRPLQTKSRNLFFLRRHIFAQTQAQTSPASGDINATQRRGRPNVGLIHTVSARLQRHATEVQQPSDA